MSRRRAFVRVGLRWGVLGLATIIAITAATTDADARKRHRRPVATAAKNTYQPAQASIVIDVNSGAVMQATNADAPRHPASLTKIMTLYMLFERLEAGKIKLTSELPVSSHAAAQAPSKLGLKPGESIRVESAIRAIVTKSANDVAVVVGEAIGGDEATFGRMMTAKARSLGMSKTTYRNASGLPDDEQITTARDQALLGRAVQERFPEYYRYFSTRTFEFRGHAMRNHNRLLGRIEGVDGIKTGYIRASGFNIVTSVHRGKRQILAVVFGGRTAAARDAKVESLIDNNINIAAVKRTAPPVVEGAALVARANDTPAATEKEEAAAPLPLSAPKREPARAQLAAVASAAAASSADDAMVGSTDPIKPNAVKTFTVHPGATRTASLSPLPTDSRKLTPSPAGSTSVTTVATIKGEPPAPPAGARPGILGVLPADSVKPSHGAKVASAGANVPVPAATTTATAAEQTTRRNGGWIIQVGAFDDEKDAKQRLNTCQTKAKDVLAKADPFTEKVSKGDKSLYRARFAGLDKAQAERACKSLKGNDIPCMLLKH